MQIGKYTASPSVEMTQRLSLILWGNSGVGKTTWACTAPGKRLLINFDPDGTASLTPTEDTIILDLSTQANTVTKEFTQYGGGIIASIAKTLSDNIDISTIIVDSVTMFAERSVHYAVNEGKAPGATFDNPGPAAYGVRNRYTNALFTNILSITKQHNKHVIFICHEDTPQRGEDSPITTLLLGGSLKEEAPLKISEVWNLIDDGKKRTVLVRSTGLRKPMKSRMFDTRVKSTFINNYDAYTDTGVKIEDIYNTWRDAGFAKIQVPT